MWKTFTIRRLLVGAILATAGLMFKRYRTDEMKQIRESRGALR